MPKKIWSRVFFAGVFFLLGGVTVLYFLLFLEVPLRSNFKNTTMAEMPVSPAVDTQQNIMVEGKHQQESMVTSGAASFQHLRYEANGSSFSLHKLGSGTGPTLLIVGGIQGDEPGGFSAAGLIATQYTISKGSVWIVPDLNLASIHARSRGLAGDMNRKFADIDPADPDYALVNRIKEILLEPQVDLILNLHDGSGFYRPTHEGPLRNPRRWGQCVIIDQEELENSRYGSLKQMAERAGFEANTALLSSEHRYHTRNTHTRQGDKEMEKTLSYFAVCNGKAAFGVEASKEFPTAERAYYHLHIIESFMRQMGIEFERQFPLTVGGVLCALNSDLAMGAYNNKVVLPLDDARPRLGFIPFKKDEIPTVTASKPLISLLEEKGEWRVAYGNRTLTRLAPLLIDFDDSLPTLTMHRDGVTQVVPMGELVCVEQEFSVSVPEGYRVNAIGAQKERNGTEADVVLTKEDFASRFSIDKQGQIFRVEVYKEEAFSGMILVRFGSLPAGSAEKSLTAVKGQESSLGF